MTPTAPPTATRKPVYYLPLILHGLTVGDSGYIFADSPWTSSGSTTPTGATKVKT
jgi:hypothetical protein